MNTFPLLVVDDHAMIRDGLKTMLEMCDRPVPFEIDEAQNCEEAIRMVKEKDYGMILMDYQLPDYDGAYTTQKLLEIKSSQKILALSNYNEYNYVSNMLKAGAKGFALKNVSSEELVHAIDLLAAGGTYYSPAIMKKMANQHYKYLTEENGNGTEMSSMVTSQPRETIIKHYDEELTRREIEILRLIVDQFTNEEIALMLDISKRTVANHRQNMINKLRVKNSVGLVRYAYEKNLVN